MTFVSALYTPRIQDYLTQATQSTGVYSLMIRVINSSRYWKIYEGWNFNSGNYLFTTDTK